MKNVSEKQENMTLNSVNNVSLQTGDWLRITKDFTKSFFFLFFSCIYRMYLILAERYRNAGVHFLRVRKTGTIWVSMKDVHNGLGVKNISDIVLKEIYGIYKTKNLTNKQTRKYKMTEKEIFEKYANLSEDELSEKCKKSVYVMSTIHDIMSTIIRRGEKKRGERKIDEFKKKLTNPESEIPECLEYEHNNISKSKDRQLKKLNKKLKELQDKIEKLTGQTTQ